MTLQSRILRLLAQTGVDKRLGKGRHYFPEAVVASYRGEAAPAAHEITATLWGLVARGLVYIDVSQSAPENWEWRLTTAGTASAKDENFNPDDVEQFFQRLRASAPDLPHVVGLYMREALICYAHRTYLASAVMLGVASEAALLSLISAAAAWLGPFGKKLSEASATGRPPIGALFEMFRRATEPHKQLLPEELRDGLTITFDAVADAIRLARNDSGHPTGRTLEREDQYIALQMAGRYLVKLSALIRSLNDPQSARPSREASCE